MNQIICKVSEEEAKRLVDVVTELETTFRLYDDAVRRIDCSPAALKTILDYYVHCQKVHDAAWKAVLLKHVGEDDAAQYYRLYRFDIFKKTIFKLDVEGCPLCKN